ncbi:MAG: hypothetical protein Ct9H300mP5_3520 [Candidatus Pelagibacterales bacterium]|nr:MAG: hypothetical protein Ct9H300mP5_3520 [Pelagibacterales bacterium]
MRLFFILENIIQFCAKEKIKQCFLMEITKFKNKEFDQYLNTHGYKFKNNSFETGGYIVLKNKKINLVMELVPFS